MLFLLVAQDQTSTFIIEQDSDWSNLQHRFPFYIDIPYRYSI